MSRPSRRRSRLGSLGAPHHPLVFWQPDIKNGDNRVRIGELMHVDHETLGAESPTMAVVRRFGKLETVDAAAVNRVGIAR